MKHFKNNQANGNYTFNHIVKEKGKIQEAIQEGVEQVQAEDNNKLQVEKWNTPRHLAKTIPRTENDLLLDQTSSRTDFEPTVILLKQKYSRTLITRNLEMCYGYQHFQVTNYKSTKQKMHHVS